MQSALLFGAVGLAMALLLVPQLRDASERYAQNKLLGVDTVVTGSIAQPQESDDSEEKIYTIRKSVLDDNPRY